MVSKFQFLLDGQYVDDPKGWEDLDTTIKRDQAISGLLTSQESQLEFFGNGYDYIKLQFDTQGFCSFIEIEIRQTCDQLNYDQIFKGIIYLSDCQFDLMRCSIKVKTVDDGFYARINNNKSIKAKLDVGRSKNDETITAAQDITVEFFNPATGNYLTGLYDPKPHCYTIFEVFKFLVAFMSDGRIDFVSDDFNVGGQWDGQCITIGNEVRLCDQSVIPQLSFQDVFTEINKKNRIGFSVEKIGGRPTLRIENAEYFYGQTYAITLSDAKEVFMQMDTAQLYSQVHLGSTITDDASPTVGQFPESIDFLGFKDETFHTVGTCNVDRVLELNSQWIISSNIIEDIFINGTSSYDSDIVLVNVDLTTNKAVRSNWLDQTTVPPYFYNEFYINKNVTDRWFKGIPNNIANFLGNADNSFQATSIVDQVILMPTVTFKILFQDDFNSPNHDVSLNYDPVLSRYTIPAGGNYTFNSYGNVNIKHPTSNIFSLNFFINRYDSGMVLIESRFIDSIFASTSQPNLNAAYSGTAIFNANATDIIQVECSRGLPYTSITIFSGAVFNCTATSTGGGIYTGIIDSANYKIKKYSFKYPLTFAQLQTIKADTKKLITFTTNNGLQQTGWIDIIKYYHHNKWADITLITN